MYVLKDCKGRVRLTVDTLAETKGRLGHGWTVWFRSPVMRMVDTQVLHKKDKVSRVRGAVAAARVGGQHSSMLVHKVDTGRFTEVQVPANAHEQQAYGGAFKDA
jgi:ribosomal protein L19